jgi:hypothetical protein
MIATSLKRGNLAPYPSRITGWVSPYPEAVEESVLHAWMPSRRGGGGPMDGMGRDAEEIGAQAREMGSNHAGRAAHGPPQGRG